MFAAAEKCFVNEERFTKNVNVNNWNLERVTSSKHTSWEITSSNVFLSASAGCFGFKDSKDSKGSMKSESDSDDERKQFDIEISESALS